MYSKCHDQMYSNTVSRLIWEVFDLRSYILQAKTSCSNKKSEGHCRWWDPKVSITWHFNRKLSALFSYLNLYPSIMKLLQMLPTITVFFTEMQFVWVLTFLCTIFYFQQCKCTYISMLYYYREELMLIVYFCVNWKKKSRFINKVY